MLGSFAFMSMSAMFVIVPQLLVFLSMSAISIAMPSLITYIFLFFYYKF